MTDNLLVALRALQDAGDAKMGDVICQALPILEAAPSFIPEESFHPPLPALIECCYEWKEAAAEEKEDIESRANSVRQGATKLLTLLSKN